MNRSPPTTVMKNVRDSDMSMADSAGGLTTPVPGPSAELAFVLELLERLFEEHMPARWRLLRTCANVWFQ